ncbi:MAG: hypothetical protein WDN06_14860 [Asticcacaulis sp.]
MALRYVAMMTAGVLALAGPAMAATDLMCDGHGALPGDAKTATAAGASGSVAADYADRVKIHLDDATGTLTLPDIMVPGPVLPYGRKKSIWPVDHLQKSDDAIEGDVAFDLIHRVRLRIDRVTGNLSISGYDSFTGICAPYNPEDVKKLF